jgi:predicted DNA-binding transcriptional regulator AlpA
MTQWLRTDAACERYGVSRSTLHRWRVYEGMPHSVIRGTILYDSNEVDKWLRQHHVATFVKRHLRRIA